MRSMPFLCLFIHLFINIYIFNCAYRILVWWVPTAINDVNVQHINVTGGIKLRNTKLCVVGHYFCCTVL